MFASFSSALTCGLLALSLADVVVSRFDPQGELKWMSVLGGADPDVGSSVNSDGDIIYVAGGTASPNLQLASATTFQGMTAGLIARMNSANGYDTTHHARTDMFLFSMEASDLTPPVRVTLNDAIGSDEDAQDSTTTLRGSWNFEDPESAIAGYEMAAGTAPGCTDVAPFASVGLDRSAFLMYPGRLMRPLTPGTWYYVTVRATNGAGLQTTDSTDGIFVRVPGGGPDPSPPTPGPCPTAPPDAGVPDAGVPDGGRPDGGPGEEEPDGPQSAVGWSCGTPGAPMGLVLLMLLALGLSGARRRG